MSEIAQAMLIRHDTQYIQLDSLFDASVTLDSCYTAAPLDCIRLSGQLLALVKKTDWQQAAFNLTLQANGIPYSLLLINAEARDSLDPLNLDWTEGVKYNYEVESKGSTGLLAYWENFQLEVVELSDGKYRLAIPSFAGFEKSSLLRLIAYNQNQVSGLEEIPLRKGKPNVKNVLPKEPHQGEQQHGIDE